MKTSKKLLSLFLAVVMAVTSCSVGMTAFASENDKSIWSTDADSDSTYAALNQIVDEYLPALLNIDAVKTLLEDKLGMTVTEDTDIQDVLVALSPVLVDLLGASSDKSDIIPNYTKLSEKYYSYLEDTSEDKTASDLDFFALYSLCQLGVESDNEEFKTFATETLAKLDGLLNEFSTVYNEIEDSYTLANSGAMAQYLTIIMAANDIQNNQEIVYMPYDMFMNLKYDGNTLVKDYVPTGEQEIALQNAICAKVNSLFASIGSDKRISSFADALFYSSSMWGAVDGMFQLYMGGGVYTNTKIQQILMLIEAGGGQAYYTDDNGEKHEITKDNYKDVISQYYTLEEFVKEIFGVDYNTLSEEDKAYYDGMKDTYQMFAITSQLKGENESSYYDFSNPYYYDMAKGLLLLEGDQYNNLDELEEDISSREITDEDIATLIETAQRENWARNDATLTNYFNSEECSLSDEVKRIFAIYIDSGNSTNYNMFIGHLLDAEVDSEGKATQNGIDYVKSYEPEYKPASLFKIKDMTMVDGINYMVPSVMCYDTFGSNFSAGVTYTLRITEVMNTVESFKNIYAEKLPYGCYDFTDYKDTLKPEYYVEVANNTLNDTLYKYLAAGQVTEFGGMEIAIGDLINEIANKVLNSNSFDIQKDLDNIYMDLYENPVETIFKLVPLLSVLLDQMVLPLVLNSDNTALYSMLDGLGLISDLTQAAGSTTGIGALNFDLNTLVPAVMHWLEGDENYAFTYYNVTPNEDGTVTYGETTTGTYNVKNTPVLTNIYFIDQKLQYAKISDVPALIAKKLNEGIDQSLSANEIASEKAKNETIGNAIGDAVSELAGFFTDAVEKYVAEYGDKHYRSGALGNTTGLNNLFVAIPYVLDNMGKAFVQKYDIKNADGTPSDWTYLYDGKMSTVEEAISEDDVVETERNNTLESLKALIGKDDVGADVLSIIVNMVAEDWLGSLIDLLGDTLRTDENNSNKITSEIPVVSGLISAFDILGENSILTDVLNSVFQITRDNEKYSFSFEEQEDTGYVALDTDNVYFLLTNLPRLIEVIMNIVNAPSNPGGGSTETTTTTSKVYAPKATTAAKANSSKYSSTDLSNATDLIGNLDKMLSSLLSDATFNDFSLDETDNILASLVTFLSNYLGRDFSESAATDIVGLINTYTYYITGSETHKPDKNGNVDDKKVYTNDSLTGLVVETYALVEKIAAELLQKYDGTYTLDDQSTAKYNLLVEAIDGIVSPDAVSIRLEGDYDSAAKTIAKYNSWSNMTATTSRGDYKVSIDWNIKAGDKEAFYDGLAASLRVLTSVIGVLLIDSGLYNTVVTPVLSAICTPNGIKLEKYETLLKASQESGNYDDTLIAILTPVSEFINLFLDKPATTLIKTVQGLAGILDDKNGTTIASVVNGALKPVIEEINGLANILDTDVSNLSPSGADALRKLASDDIGKYGKTDKNNALVNIKIGKVYKDKNDKVIADYSLPLSGANLIPIINTYLAEKGIALKNISWNKLSTAKSPAEALVYFLEYALENLLDILPKFVDVGDLLDGLTAKDLLAVINQILEASDSPTMAYWTFTQYLQERSSGFKYPAGITAAMANDGVEALDDLVSGIFPLLSSFGVDLGDSLQGVLDNNLFTNSLLTTIATALYGALDGLDPTIKAVINGLGIETSTKDVAKLLTDRSYGTTYSSAAKTISAQSSWSKVKNVNWGFKDGSSNAQQGFVNALAAILRPLNDVLTVFLNEGTLHIDDAAYDIICGITVPQTTTKFTFELDGRTYMPRIIYSMKNGVLTVQVREDPSTTDYSRTSTLNIDFKSLKNLNDLKLEGTNGYNSAIIPLLEALQCSNIKTYAQYQKDVAKAKDNLLLDILNPIIGSSSSSLLSKLAKAPATTLTNLLPNVAMYLNADGLVQLVSNLLAPVTYAFNDGKNPTQFIGNIVESLLGAPIEDMIIPLVNKLLASTGIKLPDIDWAFLASLGTASTYKSKAVGTDGKYLTGKIVDADNGKVLVTVLRYVAETLINNSATLKKLICSIDAVAKNDMISSIVKTVFNTIGTASKDQIVSAVFYLLAGNPSNAFWDYTSYETGSYSFTYPEGIDVDFLKNLPPMLDGLISSLVDLNGLISENLFTDSLITKLVTGLYGAIEGVKISDGLNLTQLLAQTGIDFSTSNVASLLVNEKYGQTYESAASVIKAAGSWKNVNENSLKWGVTDRDSFFHALVAVLRPIYGVLDVLLNDAYLGLFDIVRIPGSNGYSSSIVPLMEAFSMYNIKTQYQYRQDMTKEYDAILLDIINPIWDKVEDILNAPLQTVAAMLPNLALFIGNDGLCQIIDNLFTPVSALADAIRPIVDLNKLLPTILDALDVDLNSLLGKIGVTNFSLDLYDLKETLKPLLGADAIIPLVNNILGMIKISGTPLGIKLNPVDWLQLASHGTTVVSASQAATFGPRIFVEGDSSETLIAVLKYLIITINTGDNYDVISSLIAGLLGGSGSDMSGTINEVLSMLEGDTDQVISDLVGLLQTVA